MDKYIIHINDFIVDNNSDKFNNLYGKLIKKCY